MAASEDLDPAADWSDPEFAPVEYDNIAMAEAWAAMEDDIYDDEDESY